MLFTLFASTSLLVPLFAFPLAFYCFFKHIKTKMIVMYFLLILAAGIWGLGLFLLLYAENVKQALVCNYILYFGATLIPIFFYHFVAVFLWREQKDKKFIIIGYVLAVIFLIMTFIPPLIIGGVSPKAGFNFWEDPGLFYWPYLVYFWLYVLMGMYRLFKAYKTSEGIIKRQIYYLILASLIGFIGGGTNFLPQLFGIYPFGQFVTFLYPVLITYGMYLKEY